MKHSQKNSQKNFRRGPSLEKLKQAFEKSSHIFGDLVPLKEDTLLKEWTSKKEKFLKNIREHQEKLEAFESSGREAYHQWIHQMLPKELSREKELKELINEKTRIYHAIQFEISWLKLKRHLAYEKTIKRWKQKKSIPSEEALEAETNFQKEQLKCANEIREKIKRDGLNKETPEYRNLKSQFKRLLFDEIGPQSLMISASIIEKYLLKHIQKEPFSIQQIIEEHNASIKEHQRFEEEDSLTDSLDSHQEPNFDSDDIKLKTLYRELARSLHPDVIGNPNETQKKLWNEVQSAYEQKNRGRLLSLKSLLNLKETPQAFDISKNQKELLASLIEECLELAETLKQFKREDRNLSKDPAFEYFKKKHSEKKLDQILKKERDLIHHQLRELTLTLSTIHREIENFAIPPKEKKFKKNKTRKF